MRKSNFLYIVLVVIIGIGFAGCTTNNDYVIKSNFDYVMPTITKNGNFEARSTIYLRDIPGINLSREEILDLYLKNAWINISGDISRGDDINIYDITINGTTLTLDYYVNVGNPGSGGLDISNDNAYINFMHDAMILLNNRGNIDVRIRGYSYMSAGNLYITLCNNLDVTLREH
ncbi:hypothetical protein [Dysgonomonas macrotermitis]|uniref:Uncharacterized protein n=1 Tax=Dysgonomonas macrotermitis TaxID=1346286 RepID=A0A1M5AHN4_9BACT|nr:hypothetical protein [Dysgonomonas macrotermitis]SHF29778.1 hypothetical protein SAMN05444362_10556 [Dysgonomonas macrotermitis]